MVTEHRFSILDPGEENHEPDVEGDDVQVELGQVKVVGQVQADLAGIHRGKEFRDVVPIVQKVHEGVVVQGQRFEDLIAERRQIVAQGFGVDVRESPLDRLERRLQRLFREECGLGLDVGARLLDVVDPGQHSQAPVLQDRQLLRQLLLRNDHRTRHHETQIDIRFDQGTSNQSKKISRRQQTVPLKWVNKEKRTKKQLTTGRQGSAHP